SLTEKPPVRGTVSFDQVAIRLHPSDDVAVAKVAIRAGTTIQSTAGPLTAITDVAIGHKTALRDIPVDAPVKKYGQVIGFAAKPIRAGEHVHTHNLVVRDFNREHHVGADCRPLSPVAELRTFSGFSRPNGRA